jgi:hypothetical protein
MELGVEARTNKRSRRISCSKVDICDLIFGSYSMFSFNKNKFLFLEVLLSIYDWPNLSLKNKISQIKAGPNDRVINN